MKPIKTSTAIKIFRSQLSACGMVPMHYLNTPGYWEYFGKGLRLRILNSSSTPTVVHIGNGNEKCFDRWANSTVFTITGIPMYTGKMLQLAKDILCNYTFDQRYISKPIPLPAAVYPISNRIETIRMFLIVPPKYHTVKAWIPNNASIVDIDVDGMTLNVLHERFKDTGVEEVYFKLKKTGLTLRGFNHDSKGACYTGNNYALIK